MTCRSSAPLTIAQILGVLISSLAALAHVLEGGSVIGSAAVCKATEQGEHRFGQRPKLWQLLRNTKQGTKVLG